MTKITENENKKDEALREARDWVRYYFRGEAKKDGATAEDVLSAIDALLWHRIFKTGVVSDNDA